ncbi:MAG: flagellar biosynthesis protein FlhB [Rhodothermales bacterium]
MSEGPDRQSKTFDPTAQRIKKAREDGNVFRSQETTAVFMLGVGVSVMAIGTPSAFENLKSIATRIFVDSTNPNFTISNISVLLTDVGIQTSMILLPFLGSLFVAALAIGYMQVGWNLTTKPLIPKPDRISMLKGFKRLFSSQALFTFGKALVKIAIVGPIAYMTIRDHLPDILIMHTLSLEDILSMSTSWIVTLMFKLIGMLALISAVDFAYEKWKYKRDLKMSKQELKDEAKDQEGDPHIKGKRKELARKNARRQRLDHAVMKSDVVITNPTHYAVALRYDPGETSAPRVMAKGIRMRALRIKELAREFQVPMIEDRPLARALYASVDEMMEIPEELYPAVAAILAEIYRNREE